MADGELCNRIYLCIGERYCGRCAIRLFGENFSGNIGSTMCRLDECPESTEDGDFRTFPHVRRDDPDVLKLKSQ